jgi:hypothetical protein
LASFAAASFSIFLSSDGNGAEDASGYVPDGTDGGDTDTDGEVGAASTGAAVGVSGDEDDEDASAAGAVSWGTATVASSASASGGVRVRAAAAIAAARPPLIARVIPPRRSFVSDARAGTARGNLAASSLQATYACFTSPAPTREPRGDADAMTLPPDLDPPTLLVLLTRLVERVIALDAAAPWHPMSRPDPISAFLTTLNPRFTVSHGSASSLVAPRLRLDAPVRVTRRVRVAIPLNAARARM